MGRNYANHPAVYQLILTKELTTIHPTQITEGEATIILTEETEVEAEAEDIQDKTQDIPIIHQEDRAHIVRDHMKISIVVNRIQLKEDEKD